MQKKVFAGVFVFVAAMALAGYAHAQDPLLRKTISVGFVGPAEQTNVTCQIFADRLEVNKQAGSLTATIVTNIKLDADAVSKMIADAAKGKVTKKAAPSNEPLVRYQAVQAGKIVTLKSLGSEIMDNASDAATMLVNFIDQLCE